MVKRAANRKVSKAEGRRQEPVAPFAVAGQAEHEAAQQSTATVAPELAASQPAEFRSLPLSSIAIVRNHRKVFDETALAELAESIKTHGVMLPITVRQVDNALNDPHGYELIAGERRYHGARLAGLTEIPTMVYFNVSDRQFLEMQLLENLQRKDVRPCDEAEAFAQLLNSGFTSEEIAQRVGKPVKFILQRAKLMALIPVWMDALAEDRLPLVLAHELARLPAHSQLATKKALANYYNTDKPKYEAYYVRRAIDSSVLRNLSTVVFPKNDTALCSGVGACTGCHKRSRANQELFTDQADKDQCLDASCFEGKIDAFVSRRLREIEEQDGKKPVLLASESVARKKYPHAIHSYQFYKAKQGSIGAVRALVLDGPEAGQEKWGTLSNSAQAALGVNEDAKKAEDAARIRKERTKKMHRSLLAERLTADLPTSIENSGTVAHGVLEYFIMEELQGKATGKVDYLKQVLGWEPTAEALKDDYNTYDKLGLRPWRSWILSKLNPLGFDEKLNLFFTLKVRHRMDHEYEGLQFDIAKLIGPKYEGVAAEAEQAVQERYYTKGKKQAAGPAP